MKLLAAILVVLLQEYPDHVGVVNDFAREIDQGTKAKIEAVIEEAKTKADVRIVVVTVTSLGGQSVEAYTIGLAKKWGVGQKGQNNGILFLHAPKERKIRIENGYGVESRLTDIESKMIIERMIPLMKSGKFSEAILQGVEEISRTVSAPEKQKEKQSAPIRVKEEDSGSGAGLIIIIVALAVVFVLIFISMMGRAPPERHFPTSTPRPVSEKPVAPNPLAIDPLSAAAITGLLVANKLPPPEPSPTPQVPVAPDPSLSMAILEEQRRQREDEERRRKRRKQEEEEEEERRRRIYRSSDDSSSSSSSSSSYDSGSSSSSSDSFSGGDFGGGGASGGY